MSKHSLSVHLVCLPESRRLTGCIYFHTFMRYAMRAGHASLFPVDREKWVQTVRSAMQGACGHPVPLCLGTGGIGPAAAVRAGLAPSHRGLCTGRRWRRRLDWLHSPGAYLGVASETISARSCTTSAICS